MEHVAASTGYRSVDNGGTKDYASEFQTIQTFKSKEDLIKWAREVGKSHGFAVITLRSDSGNRSKRARVTLACERSGKCDSLRGTSKERIPDKFGRQYTGTKKCDCPFRLRGKKLATSNEWELTVGSGIHNHPGGPPERGHSSQGRLCQEEKSVVKDLYKQGAKPKEILTALNERDKRNKSTERTIYNEIQRIRRSEEPKRLEDLGVESLYAHESSVLRQLMSGAAEYNYTQKHRPNPKKDNVLDFFLTHPRSFELLRAFPTVLIVYINYDDLMGRWVGLDFLGLTSTRKVFFVASAILYSENEHRNYEWALNSLQGEMDDKGILMPDIVILDSNDAEMDAIEISRPINDVFSAAKLLISTDYAVVLEFVLEFELECIFSKETWELLKASPTEADFEQHVMQLRTEMTEFGGRDIDEVEHVLERYLEPYKEMLVAAWTDKFMHFGSRNLPAPRWGQCPFYDYIYDYRDSVVVKQTVIDRFWERMHSRNEQIRMEIDGSFRESLESEYTDDGAHLPVLKELYGAISIYALNMIREQTLRADEIDDDHSECTCAIKRTHGLPCAHEIAEYKRKGLHIPLECINSHWRQLPRLKPYTRTREPKVHQTMKRPRLSEDIGGFQQLTNTYAHSAISLPSTVESEDNAPNAGPSIVPSTQEWQPRDEVYGIQQTTTKQLEFADICPLELRPYILDIKDVPRDGHCGFRAMASFLGYSEEVGWAKVREDLKYELLMNSFHYTQLFGSDQRVNELLDALAYSESEGICSQKHWMTMPDMGHIIASCYNILLIHLSSVQCFTFFPLRTAPIIKSISSPKEMVIGFVEDHFVQVYLKAGHPMPPPIPAPTKKKSHEATIWERFNGQRSIGMGHSIPESHRAFQILTTKDPSSSLFPFFAFCRNYG
ncbi:uncharacterized protein LOC126795515 [Argentina anserina]|uniref:uncharacterized protein LOC126795515 n=1 Tax=Argentina anserina TaxID=57926 RepID=UPI0021767F61|nr:uncharacterized protein LOC126795515 [Potentilla anserina]